MADGKITIDVTVNETNKEELERLSEIIAEANSILNKLTSAK